MKKYEKPVFMFVELRVDERLAACPQNPNAYSHEGQNCGVPSSCPGSSSG